MGEHVLGPGYLELSWLFDVGSADHAVLDVQRKTTRTDAHAGRAGIHFQAQCAGEIAIAVGQHLQSIGH